MIQIKVIFIIGFFLFSACSSTNTTTTTTETTYEDRQTEPNSLNELTASPQLRKETTVVVEEKEESKDFSLIGGTIGLIGDIIALPFRIIAGIITFIF